MDFTTLQMMFAMIGGPLPPDPQAQESQMKESKSPEPGRFAAWYRSGGWAMAWSIFLALAGLGLIFHASLSGEELSAVEAVLYGTMTIPGALVVVGDLLRRTRP